ncbi:hypothetical protein GWI33_017256 [Rhynchophorus ferrugineus]|uniref:Uncharacterized protein n=1 Tax=Rhynchophorus ferrugineus TaxID=354439 RepID=A0A834HZ91_RHYFE|nr:hypothetical protein GWI33_017256 [Rhynchophorus ferrugineus]
MAVFDRKSPDAILQRSPRRFYLSAVFLTPPFLLPRSLDDRSDGVYDIRDVGKKKQEETKKKIALKRTLLVPIWSYRCQSSLASINICSDNMILV